MHNKFIKKIRLSSAFLMIAVAATSAFFYGSEKASAEIIYPSQILNLANWKQTLPIGSSESPLEITQTSLATYFLNPYFQVNSSSNGVVFRAPVNGVTTSGSGYPRSELREMIDNGANKASWSTSSGVHTMFIDQAITAVPKDKKHVVAGQIHDASDDVIVIRLEYPKLFVDINGQDGPTLDPNYTLGKRFTVKFVAEKAQIKVYYNGSQTPAYVLNKDGSGNYFKAGSYTQSNCSTESFCDSSNFGEVVIYDLAVQHAAESAPVSEPAPVPAPTPALLGMSFEAEAGIITAPMQIVSDIKASNGKYIVQTSDTGTGTAKYTFNVPANGKYQLRAKAIAPNGYSNSVYYALDANSASTWDLPSTLTSWTWTNGPVLTLSQGKHTLTIKKREKNTKLDAFELKPIVAPVVVDGTKTFEAETATVSGGMRVISDSAASGGKYVQADSSGSAIYKVNVPISGKYKVAGWIKAASTSADSFYVSVDGSSSVTWALPAPSLSWTYDVFDANTFSLSAGSHTLTLKYREAGAKVDKLILVKQP